MRKHKHEEGEDNSTAVLDRPAAVEAACPYHGHEMGVANGTLVCPEPGCHVKMALPASATSFRHLHEIQQEKAIGPFEPKPEPKSEASQ